MNQRDELFQRLQERVTTTSGWADLIRGIQHDNSQAYGVRQLCEWLRTKSGWSDDTAAKIGQAFRKAVLMIVGDEQEIWACAIDSLRVLAETITTDANDLTGEERAVFSRACKLATETIVENADDADEVRGEAGELEKMEVICGLNFKSEIEELEGYADDLLSRQSHHEDFDPESDYRSRSAPDIGFDSDALFAGLLDR